MSKMFKQLEPDILLQYYDKGEGCWQKVKRFIQNIFRRLKGDELLIYDDRDFEDADGPWFNDEW